MQFGLRALFILTTVVALTAWIVTWYPTAAAYILMVAVLAALLSILVVAPWMGLGAFAQWMFRLLRGRNRSR
jgi:hypothetical protein